MSKVEEIKHLLEVSRQMGVDKTWPITEDEFVEFISSSYEFGFVCGALWQKDQFEKNRLAACGRQTEEEAEIESDFVTGIIENEHRQPTFDDAIKYGMRLQRENMMKEAVNGLVYTQITNGEVMFRSNYVKKEGFEFGDKVKMILIKED